jgi:hypothetical protein
MPYVSFCAIVKCCNCFVKGESLGELKGIGNVVYDIKEISV